MIKIRGAFFWVAPGQVLLEGLDKSGIKFDIQQCAFMYPPAKWWHFREWLRVWKVLRTRPYATLSYEPDAPKAAA